MKKIEFVFFVLILFALMSCHSLNHWMDYESGADFSIYQTYMIDDQCSDYNPGVNPIHQQRIKNAIEVELRKMGFRKAEEADLNIKYFVKNETKYFYETCANEYENYRGGNQCIERVYTYDVGTLVIDFFDRKTNTAVWHGGAEGGSWEKMKNAEQTINKMVGKIMGDFKQSRLNKTYAAK
jgi:hypothetical protein